MSVRNPVRCHIQYRWSLDMIPWYRQLISLIYGLGVIMIALWAIQQGSGPYVILGVTSMSFMTLMLIFGIEVDAITVNVGNGLIDAHIPFTNTAAKPTDDEDDGGEDDS